MYIYIYTHSPSSCLGGKRGGGEMKNTRKSQKQSTPCRVVCKHDRCFYFCTEWSINNIISVKAIYLTRQ